MPKNIVYGVFIALLTKSSNTIETTNQYRER
jgi:hypothetical protein